MAKIKLTARSRVRLLDGEMEMLKKYLEEIDPSAGYTNIQKTVGTKRETVINAIENGYMELRTAEKLRAFLKALDKTFDEYGYDKSGVDQ